MRKTIFETQVLTGFQYMEGVGYMVQIAPAPFELEVGETYIIELDGDREFSRTAFAFDSFSPGMIAVGNDYPVTGQDDPDGLPVIIGYDPAADYVAIAAFVEVSELMIGIYQEVEEKIILRDPDGTEQEYPMRPMLEVDTTEGGTVLYSKGQILSGITVVPDFSVGDMTITAPDGYLVKSAVVAKPENLVPENIKKNEVVAGIVGTHEGGGGGGAVECVEWVQIAQRAVRQQATSVSSTVTATIPKDCLGRTVLQGNQTANGSTGITISSATPPSLTWGEKGLTVTEDDTHITFTWARTWSNSGTNFKYKYMLSQLIVAFIMGNMYIDSSSGSNVLVGKPGLKYLPEIDRSYGSINCGTELAQIDFSQTAIEEYERLTEASDANLTEIILPISCKTIGQYACASCNALTKLYSPDVAAVTDYQINLPNVKTIEGFAFRATNTFKTAVLPSVETIGDQAFYLCKALISADLPKAKSCASSAFSGCTALTTVNVPMLAEIDSYSFNNCSTLASITLPSVTSIGTSAFSGCSKLLTIDMSGVSAVPTLGSSTTIPTNSGLQILVPAALYDEWIATTNWTVYVDYIVIKQGE